MSNMKNPGFQGKAIEFDAQPTPLFGELSIAEPMDIELLGPLAPVIKAIAAKTQAPIPIAMHSVLAAAAVATQAFADVQTLSGSSPLSLFLITAAGSGERKSTCDKIACGPLRAVEAERRRRYQTSQRNGENPDDAVEVIETTAHHRSIHDDNQCDFNPKIIFSDVTIEGLAYQLQNNQPSIGLISDEGGQFLGGYSMKAGNEVGSAARLSKFWDAGQFDLIRASSEPVELDGRRVSMHMMIQPKIAGELFSNEVLRDQGLLSRCLAVWPESRIGSRLIDVDASHQAAGLGEEPAIKFYNERIGSLLKTAPPVHPEDRQQLKPRQLNLSHEAYVRLVAFYNRVEKSLGPDEAMASIQGFAAKAAEHAARIAGVSTIYRDTEADVVTSETMGQAIGLVDWYLLEMLRITEAHVAPEILQKAEQLRVWLIDRWTEDLVSVRVVTQRGPPCGRDADTAKGLIAKLVEHGWLVPLSGSAMVGGQRATTVWRIVRSG
ncbi:MAG: DUF3987 domain-containing protein [Rhodobacteraceae bacterium]|nr:DUF3987 domain-containing protein [Paracoccaceae bacterium]